MIAIYARQSVERADSVSIETQIRFCRTLLPEGAEPLIFTDKGFGGTSTARPGFQKLLSGVRQGEIHTVLIYKLDRISRSLLDFAGMMALFRENAVTLRSVREQFDTQSELGGMLLHLLMMFAELEQKTIAGRVRDNYEERARRQLPLGGVPPFGYDKDWKPIPAEVTQIRQFYEEYALRGRSVEQLVQLANKAGNRTRKGKLWSNSAVLRILANPCYVKSSFAVAVFLEEQGATLLHPPQQFCDGFGCRVFGSKSHRKGSKYTHLAGERAAVGRHPGILEDSLWLGAQERRLRHHGSTNRGSGTLSWLQGRVVCGFCGGQCYVRSSGTDNRYRYLVCRGKRLGNCTGIPALHAEAVEASVAPILADRAASLLPYATVPTPVADFHTLAAQKLEQQAKQLAEAIAQTDATIPVLVEQLEALEKQRQFHLWQRKKPCPEEIDPLPRWNQWWEKASIKQKQQATELLVETVEVLPGKVVVKFVEGV